MKFKRATNLKSFLYKMYSFANKSQWFCAFYWLCFMALMYLTDAETAKDQKGMQRRFMWKQMDSTMEDIINGVSSGTQAVKNMIGEFLPLVQTTPVTSDFATTTTRIKYIIKQPTPMKFIKIRSPLKITKVVKMPTTTTSTTTRAKPASFNDIFGDSFNQNSDNSLYNADVYNRGLNPVKQYDFIKPSAMSKLHTNIMLDTGASTSSKTVTDKTDADEIATDSSTRIRTYYKTPASNTYEVVEHIDENGQENEDFNGIYYTTESPFTPVTTISATTAAAQNISTKRAKKLRDSIIFSTANTYSINDDSWQPSVGYEVNTKPHVVILRQPKWSSTENVGVLKATSSIQTTIEKPVVKRKKNHTNRQKNHQQQQRQQQQQEQQQQQPKPPLSNSRKRGSIKFGDKIN